MRARIAASAAPSETAGSTRCAERAAARHRQPAKLDREDDRQQRARARNSESRCRPAPASSPRDRRRCPARRRRRCRAGSQRGSPRASRPPRARASPACARGFAVVTGWPVRKDVPRSPCTTPRRNRRYCSRSGRSRPSLARSSATSCGDAASPSIACAGSPGMRWMSENTSVATPSSTGIVSARRRARNRSTASLFLLRAPRGKAPQARAPQSVVTCRRSSSFSSPCRDTPSARAARARLPPACASARHEPPLELSRASASLVVDIGTAPLIAAGSSGGRNAAAPGRGDRQCRHHVLQLAHVAGPAIRCSAASRHRESGAACRPARRRRARSARRAPGCRRGRSRSGGTRMRMTSSR